MDVSKIQSEFIEARGYFSIIELYPTSDGKVYVKVGLQPSSSQYIATIYFPENYPIEMPSVFITKPMVEQAPHRYNKGNICYLHPSMWNPGVHNLKFVIQRTVKWLGKYEIWKVNNSWPGAEIKH